MSSCWSRVRCRFFVLERSAHVTDDRPNLGFRQIVFERRHVGSEFLAAIRNRPQQEVVADLGPGYAAGQVGRTLVQAAGCGTVTVTHRSMTDCAAQVVKISAREYERNAGAE